MRASKFGEQTFCGTEAEPADMLRGKADASEFKDELGFISQQ